MREESIFHRAELVTGDTNFQKLQTISVILFGSGGVGSWCAESLIRSGIVNLTIVDFDVISASNVNRQLQATSETIGLVKVNALKRHLLTINPDANITAIEKVYDPDIAHEFDLDSYDYVIDAIDSISQKIDLIVQASKSSATLFSSLGAACKVDPTRIKVANIWKSYGCRMGNLIRKKLRQMKFNPRFKVVFSDELLDNCSEEVALTDNDAELLNTKSRKNRTNGSLVHITGTFGFTLAGLIIQDIAQKNEPLKRIR